MDPFLAMGIGATAFTGATNLFNISNTNRLNKRLWEREDNAIQRRVKDMKAAGINPLMAAGQPAQSSPGQSPHIDQNIAEDLLLSAQARHMSNQNNLLKEQIKSQQQEIAERKRNIEHYKRLGLPSDHPPSWARDLAAAISIWRENRDVIGNITQNVKQNVRELGDVAGHVAGSTTGTNHLHNRPDTSTSPTHRQRQDHPRMTKEEQEEWLRNWRKHNRPGWTEPIPAYHRRAERALQLQLNNQTYGRRN